MTGPVDIGRLVDSAVRRAAMSHKQAALICGVDFSEWSRALHGKARFDLGWLAKLPWRFQSVFIPLYVLVVTERALAEWESSLPEKAAAMARATLRADDEKKASA